MGFLLLATLSSGVEGFFYLNKKPVAATILSGISTGFAAWHCLVYWIEFPLFSMGIGGFIFIQLGIFLLKYPNRIKKYLFVILAAFAGLFFTWNICLQGFVNLSSYYHFEQKNSENPVGRAAYVYHSGVSSFQNLICDEFTNGLRDESWSVDIWTITDKTPRDFSGYDLLIIAAPTYDWIPSRTVRKFIDDCSDLGGINTVAIISAAVYSEKSRYLLTEAIVRSGGNVVASNAFYTIAPQENQFYGKTKREIIYNFAKSIGGPK